MPASRSTSKLTKQEQKRLLDLARRSIVQYPQSEELGPFPEKLKEKHGVFVSVYLGKELRGCIGHILPRESLCTSVRGCSVSAAYYDERFPRLTKEEAQNVGIEISVLTDPVRLHYINAAAIIRKLQVNEGVILKRGMNTATFLPQVWNHFPSKGEFLRQLCLKAGLARDAWKDSYAEVYVYKVEKFSG
jgi:AmmeMemoRadiSam system protein A